MATKKEIEDHLKIALHEIGNIKPWFDQEVDAWIFSHPLYPVEYGGDTQKEVIQNYPKYLREFIKQRLNNNLNPLTEKETKGHGGKREGAGRPIGTTKELKTRLYLPVDLAEWFRKNPQAIEMTKKLMNKTK